MDCFSDAEEALVCRREQSVAGHGSGYVSYDQ